MSIKDSYDRVETTKLYGYHQPASAEGLAKLISLTDFSDHDVGHYHLLKTHHATNGIVFKNSEVTTIASEFVNSIDIHSLFREIQ